MDMAEDKLLEIEQLQTFFHTEDGVAKAVDGVSLDIGRAETVALVGESGCGKSVTALSIMRLVPDPPGEIAGGEVLFEGRDLLKLSEREMRAVRGNDIAMIFQEPMTSLNPVFRVGWQIMEAIRLHQHLGRKDARTRAIEMLRQVGIPSPEVRVDEYPHQMSGGMRQRVMIAMSLSCDPALLIADEPTTALDVTIQAQILDLLRELQREREMSILLITHDLGVVAETAERVAVMYASKIVEHATADELFGNPLHPYTIGLFGALPKLDEKRGKLNVIPGMVPSPLRFPTGCKFHPRCSRAEARCAEQEPTLEEKQPGHFAACWFA